MKVIKQEQLGGIVDETYPLKLLVSSKEHGAKMCQVGVAILNPGQRLPATGNSQHVSEEVSYVLSGKIRVETDTGSQIVEAGDLVFMPGDKPHVNTNISQEPAKILWFVTPAAVDENNG